MWAQQRSAWHMSIFSCCHHHEQRCNNNNNDKNFNRLLQLSKLATVPDQMLEPALRFQAIHSTSTAFGKASQSTTHGLLPLADDHDDDHDDEPKRRRW
jgi:hypothetical protein